MGTGGILSQKRVWWLENPRSGKEGGWESSVKREAEEWESFTKTESGTGEPSGRRRNRGLENTQSGEAEREWGTRGVLSQETEWETGNPLSEEGVGDWESSVKRECGGLGNFSELNLFSS